MTNSDRIVYFIQLKKHCKTEEKNAQFPNSKDITNKCQHQPLDEFPYSGDFITRDIGISPLICEDLGCQIFPE